MLDLASGIKLILQVQILIGKIALFAKVLAYGQASTLELIEENSNL